MMCAKVFSSPKVNVRYKKRIGLIKREIGEKLVPNTNYIFLCVGTYAVLSDLN